MFGPRALVCQGYVCVLSRSVMSDSATPWTVAKGQLVSSVTQSCLNLCDPMDCSIPGFPVHN